MFIRLSRPSITIRQTHLYFLTHDCMLNIGLYRPSLGYCYKNFQNKIKAVIIHIMGTQMCCNGYNNAKLYKTICSVLQIGRSLVRTQLVSLEFFIDIKSFRSHYGPGVDSASNRNEYQEHFLGVKAAGA